VAVPFLIFTRFSVLGDGGGFALRGSRFHRYARLVPRPLRPALHRMTAPSTIDERRRFLFDDKRMRDRFWLFRNLTLPSLRNQSAQVFRHLVLVSSELPEKWSREMHALSDEFGFTTVPIEPSVSMHAVVRDLAAAAVRDAASGTTRLITARLDDDDALGRTYAEEVSNLVDTPLDSFLISRRYGQYLLLRENAAPQFTRAESILGSQGLTFVERAGPAPKSVFGLGGHIDAGRAVPVIYLPTRDAFLISTHVHNDSIRFSRASVRDGERVHFDPAELRREYGVDVSALSEFGVAGDRR
jgi:hypothetical protein